MHTHSNRLVSLDAFRGLSIAGMILVNNPGSWSHVYSPLLHAEWHGWTPTDLIFPFFLFVVGVSMTFSLIPRLERGDGRRHVLRTVLKRSAIIVGLGLFMSGFPSFDIAAMRVPGVLQRIGVVYLCSSLIVMHLQKRGQAITLVGLLLGYWGLMSLVPTPGYGAGNLSPDGNLAAYVDRAIFGTHIWRDSWDPEGLLSTLPAIATTLTGVFTGYLLRSGREQGDITGTMFVVGWSAMIAGIIWHQFFPINKNLWTSSYVVFTSGAALHLLGSCYWLIEVKQWKRWAEPAVVFGMNAIAVFVFSGLFARILIITRWKNASGNTVSLYTWIYENLFAIWAGPRNGSLAFAVTTVLLWFWLMLLLYRKRIFIKV